MLTRFECSEIFDGPNRSFVQQFPGPKAFQCYPCWPPKIKINYIYLFLLVIKTNLPMEAKAMLPTVVDHCPNRLAPINVAAVKRHDAQTAINSDCM